VELLYGEDGREAREAREAGVGVEGEDEDWEKGV
jgi:hypothetical protein